MLNPYETIPMIIKNVRPEGGNSKFFTLSFKHREFAQNFYFSSGQFLEVSIPGWGEAPFAISSAPTDKEIQICVRKAGVLTSKIHELKKGDEIGIRGPFGNGFREIRRDKNLLLVAGGIGIIPFRSLIRNAIALPEQFEKIQLFYGATSYEAMLFKREIPNWQKNFDVRLCLDKKDKKMKMRCDEGVITVLFDKYKVIEDAVAIMIGPPVMYKFVIQKLKKLKFRDEDIFMSLERRMHCGIGVCQHCAIGSKYVCKDGPVFSLAELKEENIDMF